MSKLSLLVNHNPEYIRPLILRISSDDEKIDKYAGIHDWEDPEQLEKLFKSWIELNREISVYEATVEKELVAPLSEVVGLPWDRHMRSNK